MTKMYIDRVVLEGTLEALRELLPDERDSNCGGYDARDVRQWLATAKTLQSALAQQPVEPVAWECKAGGLRPLTQRQYDAQTAATKRHYTRIASPNQEPVAWMYKAEPWFDGDYWHETYETTMDKTLAYFKDKNARALCFVEK